MGVTGLWKLIEPCGKPVPVETLEGKILAVDISIWLHQVVKGYQDNKGSVLPHAHLLGLFHRLCKLLYYRVRPVFVFDGSVPLLKRETIARRQQQRSKLNNETDRIQALLLQALANEKVVQQALGASVEMLLKSPSKPGRSAYMNTDNDDLFKLPPSKSANDGETNQEYEDTNSLLTDDGSGTCTSATDSSFEESNTWREYNTNLQSIDVRSQQFINLPPEIRHEILVDIKETRKQSSWGRLHELPSRSEEFSSFQMQRLLKRRAVQESLEEAEKEMEGPTLNYAELQEFFAEEGILEPSNIKPDSKRISSDEHSRYLLVKNLNKSHCLINESKKEPNLSEGNDTTVKLPFSKTHFNEKSKVKVCNELRSDSKLTKEETAIKDNNKGDEKINEDEYIKLNEERRRYLQSAAIGPARSYMIEYGEINNDTEMEQVIETEFEEECAKALSKERENCDSSIIYVVEENKGEESLPQKENKEICLIVSDDSDTDSNFEVVDEFVTEAEFKAKKELEIVLDTKKMTAPEDDLFADIFETSDKLKTNELIINQKNCTKLTKDLQKGEISTDGYKKYEALQQMKDVKNNIDISSDKKECILYKSTENIESEMPSGNVINMEFCKKDMSSILDELKRQAENVGNIKLESIDLSCNITSTKSLNDTNKSKDIQPPESNTKTEIVEIYDSDDQKDIFKTPTKTKISELTSPSSKRSINDYFETKYVVKRTPDKIDDADEKSVTKVKSPFFVDKSLSNRKRSASKNANSASPTRKICKASKSLFNEHNNSNTTETSNKETESQIAQNQKSTEQLQSLAADLAKERCDLEKERNRQDRFGISINQHMVNDCQVLLRLFGIPYIVAPMEAEAQCAYFDAVKLTDGTITDDSDIWLFGGQTVYKNFFEQSKNVLEFKAQGIQQSFNCDRNKLIQLACLVGSDYTSGVHGIGAVTALEILASFSTLRDIAATESNTPSAAVLSTLSRFRDWWRSQKGNSATTGNSIRLNLRKKLKNVELHEGFPNPAVIDAYLSPKIDDNKEAFSWGHINVESVREFTKKTFGWTTKKTDDILAPVLKRINEKVVQASIRNYFTTKGAVLKHRELKVSKRVKKAIDTMSEQSKVSTADNAKSVAVEGNSKAKPRKRQSKQISKDDTKQTAPQLDLPSCSGLQAVEKGKKINSLKQKSCAKRTQTRKIEPTKQSDSSYV